MISVAEALYQDVIFFCDVEALWSLKTLRLFQEYLLRISAIYGEWGFFFWCKCESEKVLFNKVINNRLPNCMNEGGSQTRKGKWTERLGHGNSCINLLFDIFKVAPVTGLLTYFCSCRQYSVWPLEGSFTLTMPRAFLGLVAVSCGGPVVWP